MIFQLSLEIPQENIQKIRNSISDSGYESYLVRLEENDAIVTSEIPQHISDMILEIDPECRTTELDSPYQLVSRSFKHSDTVIPFADTEIGGEGIQCIAGPCAIESPEIAVTIANQMSGEGLFFFRGGLFKPRTSPYSFQGLGIQGMEIIEEIRSKGLCIVTEALDENCLHILEGAVDIIQIGSRNMHNFSLLKAVGKSNTPVLLKRGMSATMTEFLMAAEYIAINGNQKVILCERGIRTIADHTRNTLDLSAVPWLKKKTHLPVIVDPSHGTGIGELVPAMSQAAIAAGADGVMVEIHPDPKSAWSDGTQSIPMTDLPKLLRGLDKIAQAVDRSLAKKAPSL
jgi:3-deoxy-7-phosphoheptulonate synthase